MEICIEKDPSNNTEIQIPQGTIITSSKYPEITFKTIDDTTIPPDTGQILIDSICTTPGVQGNTPSGELNILTNPLPGITKVYNPTTAIGGINIEDNNSYRLRGQKWTSINSKGTLMAFKNTIENVAGVEDYYYII